MILTHLLAFLMAPTPASITPADVRSPFTSTSPALGDGQEQAGLLPRLEVRPDPRRLPVRGG